MAAGGMNTKPERLARAVLFIIVILIVFGGFLAWRAQQSAQTLHARMAEQGGWYPAVISAQVGEPLKLRLTSDDVTHSFAVGQMDWPAVDVYPGEVTEVTLTFDHPGKYIYICTRWCGSSHWRMRGTIEVTGPAGLTFEPVPEKIPLYVTLNLDLDAPHPASVTPLGKPSPFEGKALLEVVPEPYRAQDYLRSHSPDQVWRALRQEPFSQGWDDQQVWHLVAAVWQGNTSQERLKRGAELFAQNCAACHGENGGGDGVFAHQIGEQDVSHGPTMSGHELEVPTDFTDPGRMLGASPALLHGKIVRGGMGTGMPYWGPVFTEDQIWAIVEYLYTYQFENN